jgi:hypothetical protein
MVEGASDVETVNDQEEKLDRKYPFPAKKFERHADAVITMYIPDVKKNVMVSVAADQALRVWDFDKKFISEQTSIDRPSDQMLLKRLSQKSPLEESLSE